MIEEAPINWLRKISEWLERVSRELHFRGIFPCQAGTQWFSQNRFFHKDETQFPRHMNRWEPVGRVARVIVYPVKSLAGVQVQLVNFYLFCLQQT